MLLVLFVAGAAAAEPAKKTVSIEGITEWQLANGLKLLTLPDPGADTITVHIVYLVGSRHEGYGEKGMAHLLEHMLFKGSKRHPNLKEEFTRRGGRWNGTTSNDRTNYFETLGATDDNLEWAIAMEADRMLNSFVSKQDLDSEMTVVRNEFEMGENNPGSVLFQRMQQLAFPWHNYGNPIIGQRSDIERVPIDKLQAFYRTWYQPDNAVLIVAGRFDESRAVDLVAKHFGPLPRPERILPAYYTDEPTQDGERRVRLERVGDNHIVMALYRAPAGSHPDFPAIDVLANILGESPSGRLHRALVQKGVASAAWGAAREMHDPGYLYFGASLGKEGKPAEARDRLVEVVEGLKQEKVRAEELERARTALLNDYEKVQLDTGQLVRSLSEYIAMGDWRLFFLYRDRLRKVTLADVQRVAEQYLKPANRVLGEFVPNERPDRAEIPPTPDLQSALAGYAGGASVSLGEAFDPSPQNIDKRTVKKQLTNGIRVALLPKQTRGGRAIATLTLHWGDEKSLTNRETACNFAGAMLMRGTKKRSRAELKEAFERLNASVSLGGEGASIEVRGENLIPALRLAAEALREPAFSREEFDEMKRAALTGAEAQRNEPSSLAGVQLARHLHEYKPGHPHYTPTVEERIALMRAVKLEDAVACYRELLGATGADFAAVGDFDPDALALGGRAVRLLENAAPVHARAFAPLRSPGAGERAGDPRQGERGAARRAQRAHARRPPGFPGAGAGQPAPRRQLDRAGAGARAREGRPLLQHLHHVHVERARRSRRVPRRLDLRAAEPRARRTGDPRGDRPRGARGLQRRRGRGRQALGARDAAPRALAGPRAREPARPLPLRQAHLCLGQRVRSEDRRAYAAAGQRRPAPAHRPGAAVRRRCRGSKETLKT